MGQAGCAADPNLDVFEDGAMDSALGGALFIYKLTCQIWVGCNLYSVPMFLSIYSAMQVTALFPISYHLLRFEIKWSYLPQS